MKLQLANNARAWGIRMGLKDSLVQIAPRESSGSKSANRVDFQKDWALCELLERHQGTDDYCMLFEHHEDVCILDSAENPTRVDFFQVKTKAKGSWTISELLHRDKQGDGLRLSYLGKLYLNRINYPDETQSLTFVSNASFKVSLRADVPGPAETRSEIKGEDFSEEMQRRIGANLQAEHGLPREPQFADTLFLRVSPLSLQDHASHAKGKLVEFLERQSPGTKCSVTSLYRVLFDEVRRRSHRESPVDCFENLVASRGISRAMLTDILGDVLGAEDLDNALLRAENRLGHEQYSYGDLRRIVRQWKLYAVNRSDRNNIVLQRCRRIIIRELELRAESHAMLINLLDDVVGNCRSIKEFKEAGLSDDYVRAMALLEHMVRD